MTPPEPRPTKNEKRQEAREKARALREEQSKKAKRNKVLIQGSLAAGILIAITIVTVLIISSLRPPGPGPANMLSDGIKIGEGLKAVRTPALLPDELPRVSEANPEGIPAINIFIDYSCSGCAGFEARNGQLLRTWLENGTATVEYHILSFRDAQTAGTRYATRAGNSAACVAEHSPDSFFDFNELLLVNQPIPPDRFELTNAELLQVAQASGASNLDAIQSCINDETFSSWVAEATARAMRTGPVPVRATEIAVVTATPTVLVNGRLLPPGADLAAFVASLEESE
jgi:protein-disulfide isomerase